MRLLTCTPPLSITIKRDPDLLQFRTEAARLLGIPLANPPGKRDDK